MFSHLYGQTPEAPAGSQFGSIIMMLAIFAIFYFILIRPQTKKAKQLERKRAAVKKGDKVITGGGIKGVVTNVKDQENIIVVEIAKGIKIEVIRSTLMNVLVKEEK